MDQLRLPKRQAMTKKEVVLVQAGILQSKVSNSIEEMFFLLRFCFWFF